MPAYRAEHTLEQTVADIPDGLADELILVDDASPDDTVRVARDLGIVVFVHERNRGYGGNQKTCYTEALRHGAEIIVLLHPDYQYDPKAVPLLIAPIIAGNADMTFGSRFAGLGDPLGGGMPMYRFLGNRLTTTLENMMLGSRFTDMHSGMRAYTRQCLLSLPFVSYSDDFWFDSQMLVDAVTLGHRVVEVPIPTRYTLESSSIAVGSSLRYIGESLLYCAERSALRGKRGRRSPSVRRSLPTPTTESNARQCPVCGGDQRISVDSQRARCRRCALVRLPSNQATTTEIPFSSNLDPLRQHVFSQVLDLVRGYIVPGNRLLDIEAGTGQFLAMSARQGWKSWGLEPSAAAVKVARERFHVEIEESSLDTFAADGTPSDVITMLGVLERLSTPVSSLRKVRSLIADEGLLILEVGRERNSGAVYYSYSPESVRLALAASGFRLIEYKPLLARQTGLSLQQLLQHRDERGPALAVARPQ
ncbi:MAG: glycosyltransferase [Actinomycetota bacterium]